MLVLKRILLGLILVVSLKVLLLRVGLRQEIKQGLVTEFSGDEHDHLKEFPTYYTNLLKMESRLRKKK
jgi:hypothetical protein